MDDTHISLILSKFDEIHRQINEVRRDGAERGRHLHEKIEATNANLSSVKAEVVSLTGKVDGMDGSITAMTPTVREFNSMKDKADGAGKLGRALWWLGGVLIGAAFWLSSSWANFATWFRPPPSP